MYNNTPLLLRCSPAPMQRSCHVRVWTPVTDGRRHRHSWARKLKKVAPQQQTQFVKQERNTQNAIALLNYLKPIAPQQLMLRTQVFTQKNVKAKERNFVKYVTS